MGPTWVLSAPDGLHAGLMNLAIWVPLNIRTSCGFSDLGKLLINDIIGRIVIVMAYPVGKSKIVWLPELVPDS